MPYEDVLAARREQERLEAAAAEAEPDECPLCGWTLQVRSDGARNCPMGHYRWEA
ncbi:MAG: hypothetical protein AB7I38_17060 [Dehalococcoidia bacterium]